MFGLLDPRERSGSRGEGDFKPFQRRFPPGIFFRVPWVGTRFFPGMKRFPPGNIFYRIPEYFGSAVVRPTEFFLAFLYAF